MSSHIFERNGMGKPPYRYLSERPPQITTSAILSCDLCGTLIKNEHFICSADGVYSRLGSECIKKSDDSGLIASLKASKSRVAEEERLNAVHDKQNARYGRTIQAIMADRKAFFADKEKQACEFISELLSEHPLLSYLDAMNTPFTDRVLAKIASHDALSPSIRSVLIDINAKRMSGARKNSKAYKAVYPDASSEVVSLVEQVNSLCRELALAREYAHGLFQDSGDVSFDSWKQIRAS